MTAGMKVCFTGLGRDTAGGVFDRAPSEAHARRIGLEPVKSVTTKNCDLLVAADGDTSSEKARKARRYGIAIVDADDFHAAAAGAVLPAKRTVIDELAALVCEICGRSWTRPAGGRCPTRCPGCSRR
jgi:DNA polymerase-3 subunit epsilon